MKNGRYLHYFDTCVFLHWLSDPEKDRDVVDGIEQIVSLAEQNKSVIIVTSVITRIEVLKTKMTSENTERFARMLGQFSVQSVNVDPRVAMLAHDIRDYYQSQNPSVKFSTPDCIHLATAIQYGCDEMNTLDGSGERKRKNDLITISENVMGGKYQLLIRKPLKILPPAAEETPKRPLFQLLTEPAETNEDEGE